MQKRFVYRIDENLIKDVMEKTNLQLKNLIALNLKFTTHSNDVLNL